MNYPIVRIEFESMKHSLKVALGEHICKLDTDIQDALDKYCSKENMSYLINKEVKQAVDIAVKEEIVRMFQWNSHGRAAIRAEIEKFAEEHFGDLK